MSGFKPSRFKPEDRLPKGEFVGKRPTVVLLIMGSKMQKDRILFVKSAHGPWIPPQGGIEKADLSLYEAVVREAWQELELPEQYIIRQKMHVLGEFLNEVPSERNDGVGFKHLYFMAVPVWADWEIKLNKENQKYVWVTSPEGLQTIMANTRKGKYVATCDAIQETCRLRMLPRWDCSSFDAVKSAIAA